MFLIVLFHFILFYLGDIRIWSPEELDTSVSVHHVQIGRHDQTGWLVVDGQRNVSGQSPGRLTKLNGEFSLCVGGFELNDLAIIPPGARFSNGFEGKYVIMVFFCGLKFFWHIVRGEKHMDTVQPFVSLTCWV